MRIRVALVAGLLAVSGCTTTGLGGGAGILSTAPAGASKNGKVAAGIINAMDGGLIGGSIGAGLSDGDRRRALEAEYRALEYAQGGQAVAWKGEQANRNGEVVAGQPYRVGSQDCRQYSQTVFTSGTPLKARGTACRNPDGSWTPLS